MRLQLTVVQIRFIISAITNSFAEQGFKLNFFAKTWLLGSTPMIYGFFHFINIVKEASATYEAEALWSKIGRNIIYWDNEQLSILADRPSNATLLLH